MLIAALNVRQTSAPAWFSLNIDREGRTFAEYRVNANMVPQQISEPLHDGEAEPQATASLVRGILKLTELPEYCSMVLFRDSDASIANLDA
jgi:hypothetical protein